jgi:hypothetical protein
MIDDVSNRLQVQNYFGQFAFIFTYIVLGSTLLCIKNDHEMKWWKKTYWITFVCNLNSNWIDFNPMKLKQWWWRWNIQERGKVRSQGKITRISNSLKTKRDTREEKEESSFLCIKKFEALAKIKHKNTRTTKNRRKHKDLIVKGMA